MAVSKSVLEEAILEAKTIREAAIQNAYKTLEENLTPSIKEMLANKLEEEINLQEEDNSDRLEEDVNAGFKEVSVKSENTDPEESEDVKEDPKDEEEDSESKDEENEEDVEVSDDEPESEEDDKDEQPAEEFSDDTNISDLTVGDLKDLIAAAMSQAVPQPASEAVDMEPADVEGMGDEEVPLSGEVEPEAELANEPEVSSADGEEDSDEEEIDLSELLKELEAEESKSCENCKKPEDDRIQKLSEELEEAYKTVDSLKTTLAETNLLNSKLMHTIKLFNEHSLSDSQKANVIKSIDRAGSPKEVKVVFNTLKESLKAPKKTTLKEHRGFSSKSAGTSTAAKQVVETNDWVQRMQELAGIV